eukprot:m.74709 g.74709  ORF g.74709 m.74709 type:complete len:229 (+) comp12406_c1_seq15:254-940(+)
MKMREVGPSIGTCGVALLAMLIFTNACLNMGAESFTGNLGEPLHQANCTRVLIVYHSETNWTKAFAEYVMQGAYDASKNTSVPTDVILTSVEEATCDQLVWADGIILGSPVYFATMSGPMKTFLDSIQFKCFGWPITQMMFKVGGAFNTGGQQASGRDTTNQDMLAVMLSLHMSVVGGPSAFGASARHKDSATEIVFTQQEIANAMQLGRTVAIVSNAHIPLRSYAPQ